MQTEYLYAVSDSTVTNTNVYAGSNSVSIAPSGYYDSASTASGITNIANRYVYASDLQNTVNESTATLILTDRQGAVVNLTDSAVVSGISVDWGDGSTSDSLTHTYTADGIYNVSATLTNYLDQTGITLTDRVQIGETAISISVSPATLSTGQSWTLTANAVIAESVQWQVSRNNASWTDIPEGTYTPTEYGTYYFRAIAYGASATAYSNVVQTTYQYAVTDSTVVNTNVYAGSNLVSIAPGGYYDAASTATGITNVANRYIYATALEVTESGKTALYSISGMQGSTSTLADGKVVQGYLWDYGDGKTAQTTQLSHSYDAPGRYVTTLQLYNYLDSTGITLTANPMYVGPLVGALTADKTAGALSETFNITANVTNYTSIDWYLARYSDGQWYVITDAHGTTLSYAPNQYGDWYFRAKATNSQTGFSQYTDTIKITIYRPPVITNTQITPDKGPANTWVTASATVTDSAPGTKYQWQSSSDGQNWEDMFKLTGTSMRAVASQTTYYRLVATGAGGTTYGNAVKYTYYPSPAFDSVSASASVVALPGSVVLSASASDTNTYIWKEQKGDIWVNIGTGAKLTERIQTAGVHTYRVLASGYGGQTYSNTITVDAGYVPQVSITNPPNAQKFNMGTTVIFTASISGADTFTWDFGTGANIISLGTTSQVNYTEYGYKTVKVTATNKYGSETAGITIYIVNGDRPLATDRFDPIDTGAVDSFVNQFDVAPGTMPNPVDIIMSLFDPLDNAFKGFFWVLVFGAIMIVIWLITKSIAIPSVLGILFGAFMVGFMPDMYIMPATALIAAGCIGGLIYVITKHN